MRLMKSRGFGDVLAEVEAILDINKELESQPDKHAVIDPLWMDHILSSQLMELENSDISGPMIQGLDHLKRLLRVQRYLIGKNMSDMVHPVTLALVRQKAALESQKRFANLVKGIRDTAEPSMTGAAQYSGNSKAGTSLKPTKPTPSFHDGLKGGFRLRALGCSDKIKRKYGISKHIRLDWCDSDTAFHCTRQGHSLMLVDSKFCVTPDSVSDFVCSEGSGKVLIKSLKKDQRAVPLFLDMAETNQTFRNSMLACSKSLATLSTSST